MKKDELKVPLRDKTLLTLDEASALTGIGVNKIRHITNEPGCPFVLWNASKRMIKRELFESYLLEAPSV